MKIESIIIVTQPKRPNHVLHFVLVPVVHLAINHPHYHPHYHHIFLTTIQSDHDHFHPVRIRASLFIAIIIAILTLVIIIISSTATEPSTQNGKHMMRNGWTGRSIAFVFVVYVFDFPKGCWACWAVDIVVSVVVLLVSCIL